MIEVARTRQMSRDRDMKPRRLEGDRRARDTERATRQRQKK